MSVLSILVRCHCSIWPSQLCSTAYPSISSATCSPTPVTCDTGGKRSCMATGSFGERYRHMIVISMTQPGCNPEGTCQLLNLPGLEECGDGLKEFSIVQEMISMSKEQFVKTGQCLEAQMKLQSKSDDSEQRPQHINGIVELKGKLSLTNVTPAYLTYSAYIAYLLGFLDPLKTLLHGIHRGLLVSPHFHIEDNGNSSAISQDSSSSPGALLEPPTAVFSIELRQYRKMDQRVSVTRPLLQMALPAADVKLIKKAEDQQLDNPCSDAETRLMGMMQLKATFAMFERDQRKSDSNKIHLLSERRAGTVDCHPTIVLHSGQVDNFTYENENHLLIAASEWLRFSGMDSIGSNRLVVITQCAMDRGRSLSTDQCHVYTLTVSMSQNAPCAFANQRGILLDGMDIMLTITVVFLKRDQRTYWYNKNYLQSVSRAGIAMSQSRTVVQSQVENCQHENGTGLSKASSEWLRFPQTLGSPRPIGITQCAMRSFTIEQCHVYTSSLSQNTPQNCQHEDGNH